MSKIINQPKQTAKVTKPTALIKELKTITETKAIIAQAKKDNTIRISSAYKHILEDIKAMKLEDKVYAQANKKTLIKLYKLRLTSNEPVLLTACNVMILGLSVDSSHSLSNLNFVISRINKKIFTKAAVNKLDKDGLIDMIKAQKKLEAKVKLELLIKNATKAK